MMQRFSLLGFFSLLLVFQGFAADSTFVAANHPDIHYSGRFDRSDSGAASIYWAGSSVKLRFKSSYIKVVLDDEKGENYFNAIIDGKSEIPVVLNCEEGEKSYWIAAGFPPGEHTLELYKRTEPWQGSTRLLGFVLDQDGEVFPIEPHNGLKIEFYGNSITSGMGNEDFSARGTQNSDPATLNNYLSYASITARNLGAEKHCISLSGIGITVSWGDYIMPEIYNRTNPFEPQSRWNFSQWTPDVVVVNLFQNDSWLVNHPRNKQYKKRFPDGKAPGKEELVEAYFQFISKVRDAYPHAQMICALGSMDAVRGDSPWFSYVEAAVEKLRKKRKDNNIHTFRFPYCEHPAHPTVFHDYWMADMLTQKIKEILNQ